MNTIMNFPLLVLVLSLAVLWFSAQIGVFCRRHLQRIDEDDRQDLSTVVAATLTLLGLIIAFSFSMAISRYDQRKNYEAEEANAIGTEYLRANLLSGADADRVHQLLQEYVRHGCCSMRHAGNPSFTKSTQILRGLRPSYGPLCVTRQKNSQHPPWLSWFPV